MLCDVRGLVVQDVEQVVLAGGDAGEAVRGRSIGIGIGIVVAASSIVADLFQGASISAHPEPGEQVCRGQIPL